jgi:dihydrodipicolinate reductase
MSEQIFGYISLVTKKGKVNKKTAGHAESLKKLGYTVHTDVAKDHLAVECSEFFEGLVDLTLPKEEVNQFLKGIQGNKQLIAYTCGFKVNTLKGVRTFGGWNGCSYLGELSCLVAKREIAARKKVESTFSVNDLLDSEE